MQNAQLKLYIVQFAYSGNGGVASSIPEIGKWLFKLGIKISKDDRISSAVGIDDICDTPITMTRNAAVQNARSMGADFMLMIDSDNEPDVVLGKQPYAKPFWDTSFDFLYERKMRGLPTCVGAPYSGPPPHPTRGGEENPYLFQWENTASDEDHAGFRLAALSRTEAALRKGTGIQPAAALPTGLILYTLDCFDLMTPPYFHYEWEDKYQSQKASTEDVVNTRDLSILGHEKIGEDIVFVNHDAWAGHRKVKTVGPPEIMRTDMVSKMFAEAVMRNVNCTDRIYNVDFESRHKGKDPDEGRKDPSPINGIGDWVPDKEVEPTAEVEDKYGGHPPILPHGLKKDTLIRVVDGNLDHLDEDLKAGEMTAIDEVTSWPEESNGKDDRPPMTRRMIASKSVQSVGNNPTTDDQLEELSNFIETLSKQKPGLRIIEVGSWVGESALAMAQAGNGSSMVFCIDTFAGSDEDDTSAMVHQLGGPSELMRIFLENVGETPNIKLNQGGSTRIADQLDHQDADVILIDTPPSRLDDEIDAWLPHLHPDGFLCGIRHAEVKQKLSERFLPAGCDVRVFESLWFVSNKEYQQCLTRSRSQSSRTES